MSYGTMTMSGKTFVLVPRDEFEALTLRRTPLPKFPPADAEGNVPALEYARASIGREIITRREAVGLTQKSLATAARVRVETLNRIERAKVTADTATIVKIDKALKKAESNQSRR